MAKLEEWELKLQSRYDVHFPDNTLGNIELILVFK